VIFTVPRTPRIHGNFIPSAPPLVTKPGPPGLNTMVPSGHNQVESSGVPKLWSAAFESVTPQRPDGWLCVALAGCPVSINKTSAGTVMRGLMIGAFMINFPRPV
jgi:hypothetical protein